VWQARTRDAIRDAIIENDESVRALNDASAIDLDVRLRSRSKLTSTLRAI
jgi:hypothetical protein